LGCEYYDWKTWTTIPRRYGHRYLPIFDNQSGSSNLWIPSSQCLIQIDQGCEGKSLYNHSKSSTYTPDACQILFIPYGTGFMGGYLSNDTVTVGGIAVKQQEFGEAIYIADFFSVRFYSSVDFINNN
jgi:hypothetical protein